MRFLDSKVKRQLPRYLWQCGLATGVLMVVFSIEDMLVHAALFAAIGSTTFVLFVTPSSPTATPRRVIGGHAVGVAVGGALALLLRSAPGLALQSEAPYVLDLAAALSVGLAIFVMAATDTEHAPAAGTSLGLVLAGWHLPIVIFMLSAAAILSAIHHLLGHRLKDLI
jgi:CBS-domain-containing membrane protein